MMTREQAEVRTRQLAAVFPRIDRLESRLTTWGEFTDAADGEYDTNDRQALVWVVAVSGVYRVLSHPAGVTPPDFRWGVAVYDLATGGGLFSGGGPEGDWPPYFDDLG